MKTGPPLVSLRKFQEIVGIVNQILKDKLNKSKLTATQYANQTLIRFNDQFGISKLEQMQMKVIEAENTYSQVCQQRLEMTKKLIDFQKDLASIRKSMNNTSREDDVYLKLFTQEHEKLKELKSLRDKLNNTMEKENLLFNRFSQRLRESHQLERYQNAKQRSYTMVLSLIYASITGLVTVISLYSKFLFEDAIINRLERLEKSVNQALDKPPKTIVVEVEKTKPESKEIPAVSPADSNANHLITLLSPSQTIDSHVIGWGLVAIGTLCLFGIFSFR